MGKKGKPKATSRLEVHKQDGLEVHKQDGEVGQKNCLHYMKGMVHLKKTLIDILDSTHPLPCYLCQDVGNNIDSKEDVGKQNKNKKGTGGTKMESKMWVCLSCGAYFCATHIRKHGKETQHWWASNHDDPSTVTCFKCEREVQVKIPSIDDKDLTEPTFVIQGLPYLGFESCFNAVVQNLLSFKLLRKQMLSLEFPDTACVSIALRDFVVATNGGSNTALSRISSIQHSLLSRISSTHPPFSKSHMDVRGLFLGFLHVLHKEQKKSEVPKAKEIDSTEQASVVDVVFAGQCSVIVSCQKCCSQFVEDKRFICLSLPILSRTKEEMDKCLSIEIEDCLAQYTHAQPWTCTKCSTSKGKKQEDEKNATKRIAISVPPAILPLHLYRPTKDQSKSLRYPENLDISPFMDPRSKVDGTVYKLVGVVVQYNGGHYANVTANRGPTNVLRWFKAKDEQIETTKFNLFEDEPHLLFYEKLVPNNTCKVIEKKNKKDANVKNKKDAASEEELDQMLKSPAPLVTETHVNIVRGLPNLHTMCFFNSILQVLLSIEPLRAKILGLDIWRGPLGLSLKHLFVETSILNSSPGPLNQMELFKTLCSECSAFKQGTMEDSHELLRIFLECLHKEEINTRHLIEEAVANSIFAGTLSSTISSIQCSHSSTKHDPFLDISLPIPSRSLPVSIEDCWALYTMHEPLDSQWLCPDCTSAHGEEVHSNAMKKILIASAPPVLAVTLSRFTYSTNGTQKLEKHVQIKEMFDLEPFMEQRSKEIMYRLIGVVQHIGHPARGHYIAYVRGTNKMESQEHQNSSKSWFYANDESIRKASLNEVLSCEAYLLFYERCSSSASQYSGILTSEDSQLADINMQPYSSAQIVDEESQHADINIQAHSFGQIMGEESRLACQTSANINMQCQTSATASCLSPMPPNEVHLWEFQRTRNKEQKRKNTIARRNDSIGQNVKLFLNRFILKGDIKPFYQCELVNMCERGSGSQVLTIDYCHLLKYSKRLAMDVCNARKRLGEYLKEAAIEFAQEVLDADLNCTDNAKKRMQELASIDSTSSLELKFRQMPKMHKLLSCCLSSHLTRKMKVYGHKGSVIRTPVADKCAVIQKLLQYMINSHINGFSWYGDFTIGDIDVYDDKVFISKPAKLFPIHPRVSQEMIDAMQRDLRRIALSIVQKFFCLNAEIPYLISFYDMLNEIENYAEWWLEKDTADNLRELIIHHPFLKPPMARANLWSGIFNACRSYDEGDTVKFKKILVNSVSDWAQTAKRGENRMLKIVFHYKDQAQQPPAQLAAPSAATGQPSAAAATATEVELEAIEPSAATELEETEPVEETKDEGGYYRHTNHQLLFEFMRHLSHHGSEYSFQYRLPNERQNVPRRQLMKSLDESEVAGAVLLHEYAMKALTTLLKSSAMKELLESVWECYKNSNYPYRPEHL